MTPPKKRNQGRPGGPKKAAPPPPPRSRLSAIRGGRTAIVGFGATFVLLIVGFAVAQGIGQPDVPSGSVVLVEDAPDGSITRETFDRALEQQAAGARLPAVPEEGTPSYENLRDVALNELIDIAWIEGEAEERGVTISDDDVAEALADLKRERFPTPALFEAFLTESKFTQEDVELRLKLTLLSDEITSRVRKEAAAVSDEAIEDYYESVKGDLGVDETRGVRIFQDKDEATVQEVADALGADSSDANWRKLTQQFGPPGAPNNGGLRSGITPGLFEDPLNSEIFAAELGTIVGPVKTKIGYYVFEVETIEPARTRPLDEVRDGIARTLRQNQQRLEFDVAAGLFLTDYFNRWQARTFCAEGFIIDRCANFEAEVARPQGPLAACYAEAPKRRPAACPAPLGQSLPSLPGTISVLQPQGIRLPQRPRPDLPDCTRRNQPRCDNPPELPQQELPGSTGTNPVTAP